MRQLILACAGLLACCCTGAAGVSKAHAARQTTHTTRGEQARTAAITWLGGRIKGYQHSTWRWEELMGARLTPTAGRVLAKMSVPDVEGAVRLWKRRARAARVRAEHPPHLGAFLCIHRYEGAWTDGSAPYYGGLQMDLGFQRTYAPQLLRTKGTADHWTPLEQIWTAEKASRSRGFWPWPSTARLCGLI